MLAAERLQRVVSAEHFRQPLEVICGGPLLLCGWQAGQFVEVAQPAPSTATATDALRFAEAARLHFTLAPHLSAVRGQMLTPRAHGPKSFDSGATHT